MRLGRSIDRTHTSVPQMELVQKSFGTHLVPHLVPSRLQNPPSGHVPQLRVPPQPSRICQGFKGQNTEAWVDGVSSSPGCWQIQKAAASTSWSTDSATLLTPLDENLRHHKFAAWGRCGVRSWD